MERRSRRQRGGDDSAELAGAQTAYDHAKAALIVALKTEIETLRANDPPDKSRIDALNERLDELELKPDDETQSVGVGGRRRRKSRRSRRPRKSRRSRRSRRRH